MCVFFLASGLFFSACRSAPALPPPAPLLVFNSIEAESPDKLTLNFTLTIENPLPRAGVARIERWRVEVNGRAAYAGFSLRGGENGFPVGAGVSATFPLRLQMDVPALAAQGLAPADNYEVTLTADVRFPHAEVQVSALAAFVGMRPPEFTIIDIAILQAELINTRFRVGMRIENPNPFPLTLSAFGYELYGNGLFWADGMMRDLIEIPAKSYVTGNLLLLMNFMGMRRGLLDQIINLVDVNYRFVGRAHVSTGITYLPEFIAHFDLSGFSQVIENRPGQR